MNRHVEGPVAVLLPHYRAEEHLARAIASILEQEAVEVELYVVDDDSPGIGWLKALGPFRSDRRVFAYRTTINVGPYRIKNELLRKVRTPLVAFQDADDVSAPDRLRKLIHGMKRTGADIVGSSYYEMDPAGRPLRLRRMVQNCNLWLRLGKSHVSLHGSTLMRRSVLEQLGGFDGSVRFAADADFIMRAAQVFKVRNVREALYYYRLHSNSLSNSPITGLESKDRQRYLASRADAVRKSARLGERPALIRSLRAPCNDVAFQLIPVQA